MPTIEERLARLEKAAGAPTQSEVKPSAPVPKFDPTAQLRMPANVMQAMIAAVPNAQAVANDHIGRPTSLPTVHGRSRGRAGSNWIDERPLQKFGGENFGTVKED